RLARNLRVVGAAKADPAALAVHLDDSDVDLVAAVQHVLDGRRALARRDVRDVQEAVGALRELDEGPEGRRLYDLPVVLVANLDLLGHGADAVDQPIALLAARRIHED